MADFDLAYALDGDASGMVNAAAQGEKAIDGLGEAGRRAKPGLDQAEAATAGVARAATDLTGIESRLDAVLEAVNRNTIGAAKGHDALRNAIQAQGNAAAATAATTTALGNAEADAAREANLLAIAEQNLAKATSAAAREAAAAELTALRLANAQKKVNDNTKPVKDGLDEAAKAANRNSYAVRSAGQQFGDFATQVALGGGFARAFASQAGQMGYALSEMTGKLGAAGRFLVGPWGIALTTAAVLLAPLIEKLTTAKDEAGKLSDTLATAATRSDSFGNAQSLLSKAIDLATGKLKTHNSELRETIRLQAEAGLLAAQKAEKDARDKLQNIGQPSFGQRIAQGYAGIGSTTAGSANIGGALQQQNAAFSQSAPLRGLAREVLTGDLNATQIRERVDAMAKAGQLAGRTAEQIVELKNQLYDLPRALNDKAANQAAIDALDGKGIDPRLVPYERDKKPPKGPSAETLRKRAEALAEFGNDTSDKIANIVGQFDSTPPVLRQINQQVRQLDDIIDDLGRRKPPNFKELIADAERAKVVVQNGINRPFNDFVRAQQESLAVLQLQAQGRDDEAEAMRQIIALERQVGPLSDARKDAVLATVQAMRAEQRQIDINRAHVQLYTDALGQIKGVVEDATQAFVRGDLGQFIKSPGKLVDAFASLQGRVLFEKLFSGAFRELQDQVNGTSVVEDASARMADAVDLVSQQTDDTTAALRELATAARGAGGAVAGGKVLPAGQGGVAGVPTLPGAPNDLSGLAAVTSAAIARALGTGAGNGGGGGATVDANGDIVVTGRRQTGSRLTRDPQALFSEALGKVGTKISGLFTNPENAQKIGASIGNYAGKAIGGAATGQLVSGLANSFGVKLNNTGAQIGGAAGAFLPIPGGSVLGSIAGGLIGNLFGSKTHSGYSTIATNGAGGNASYISGGKNSDDRPRESLGYAGNVLDALQSAAKQLGGRVASNLNLGTIGTQNDKYVYDPDGAGRQAGSKVDTLEEAVKLAIGSAFGRNAIEGISDAMRRALASSKDVDAAVAEALKVKEVEQLIGGLGDTLKAQFAALDSEGQERLRIARQYGLDVAKVEKANADERAKLVESALKSSVGSLQNVLASMASGDLFEGSAVEKRDALLAEIGKVRTKADAGEEGAADDLASLYQQLLTNTKGNIGTAGDALTSDRQLVSTGAQAVIKAQQDRINAAAGIQEATKTAVEKGNVLTNETNNLLAVTNNRLEALPDSIAGRLSSLGGGVRDGYGTGRYTSLV